MRLKCIKLAGFKSFVDPTTVNFPSNMSAVVGPNGCGKSNVIDAVRWVMGESSAKNLRGESMTDVIFNGSVNRQPVGQASIELVFDNSEGKLGGEYARFSEIAIKRKVTREGQSEYFLNGTKCRRRDITDIFLGTGLGPRSYAIIEQGMISKLIEAKPDELRVFIEEAAGISKYKERRRETENRMRRTTENLERLTDLRDELERQLQHLQRQAQAAEKYTEFKKEERLLKAQLQALQWREVDTQVQQYEQVIRELELEREAVITEQLSTDTAIEKSRDAHTQLNDAFNEVQGRYYSIGAEIARAEGAIQHQQERERQLREDLRQAEDSLQEANRHLVSDSEKVELWTVELEEILPELEMTQAQEEESAAALLTAEDAMQAWQQRWDEFNSAAAEPRQQAEVQQSRIQHMELSLQRIRERMEKLEQERQGLGAGEGDDEIELLQQQLEEMELRGEQEQQRLDDLQPQIAEARNRIREYGNQQDSVRSALQRMRGRLASLEALQQAAMGQGEAVQSWSQQHGLEGSARLAERLNVAEGWETAVETVLGDRLQSLCVDAIDGVATLLGDLEQGCINFVDCAAVAAVGSGGDTLADHTLANKVSGSVEASALLSSVRVAEDLTAALALRASLAAHESVVTRDGLWLGPNWLRVVRGDDDNSGVLQRQQELAELREQLIEEEARGEQLDGELEAERERLQQLEQRQEQLQREVKEHSRQYSELRSKVSAQQARIEQISARRQRLQGELAEQRSQFEMEQESLAEARMLLQDAIERMESDSGRREQLLQERDDSRSVLDQARQKARHDKDHSHQLAMRHQSLRTQLDSVEQAIARGREQVSQLEQRREMLSESLEQGATPLEEIKMELEARLEQRLKVEEELSEARRKLEAVEHELRESERRRHGTEQKLQAVAGRLEKARVDNQGLQVSRRNLQEQLQESQHDPEVVLAELPEDANESGWKEQLEQIDRRIQRLGAINLAAIDEYKSQSERKHYLDAQNDDLIEALETLEAAIKRIDKETRNRFKDTFDRINSGLQELFPRVFGGGTAYLELTGDDMLDTGVAIMARPPGKKNSTIHLLSGGEKALTAIALVFSIFRLTPAPFCMLDEVDAPLDDANVGRYARMVKEMSEQVQFIYITHNKIAMEMADQLMGVTMHEPGVSRLVTVDLEAAAEMAVA